MSLDRSLYQEKFRGCNNIISSLLMFLLEQVIDMSLAPRIENGILIPRGSPREIPKRVQKIFCVNPDIMG